VIGRSRGGILILAALTVLWGSNWPAMKLAVRELDPWTFRTICLLVGGGGLLALVRVGGLSLRVPRAERGPLALVTLFNITGWHLCSAYALTLVQAGRGAIIAYTMPLWTVLFGRLLLGERLTHSRLLALGLGSAGMAVLVVPEAAALWAAPAGALLMLGAAASWGIGTVLTKTVRWTIPTAVLTGWQVVLGGVPIALGAMLRLARPGDAGSLSVG
jgi:drug/metabolite transporter (DMT)-like permease